VAWPGAEFVVEAIGDLALVIEELAPYVRARPAADWTSPSWIGSSARSPARRRRRRRPAGRAGPRGHAGGDAGDRRRGRPVGLAGGRPREALSPLGPAPPGYAVLAALAAQLAQPERRVVAFTDAAGLAAGEPALGLAVGHELPLVVVVLGGAGAVARRMLDGIELSAYRGESDFPLHFSRAFLAGRPSLVAVETPGRIA